MKFTIIAIIILFVIILLAYLAKDSKPQSKEQQLLPYKKKPLLTPTESDFYKILKSKCDNKNLLIFPKVRLEDYIEVTSKEEKNKYRGRIKSRHIDFLICDNELNIIMGIELDDKSHNRKSTQETDEFKNQLFNTIGIPLARIKTNPSTYETEIDNILINHTSSAN